MIKLLNWIKKPRNSIKYMVQSPMKQLLRTGCYSSRRDNRDYPLSKANIQEINTTVEEKYLPITGIKDQLQTNSCVAFSIIAAYESARLLAQRDTGIVDGSEQFLYYYSRAQSNLQDFDEGSCLRDGLNAARQDGIALEQYCPFYPVRINEKPSLLAQATARFLRIKNYYRCWNFEEIIPAIIAGMPLVTAIQVREDFFSHKGVEPFVSTKPFTGLSHAIAIVGFDDNKKALLIKNSWGELWGNNGMAWYDYAQFKQDSTEVWAVKAI